MYRKLFYLLEVYLSIQMNYIISITVGFVYNELQGTRTKIRYSRFSLQAFCGFFLCIFIFFSCSFINELSPLSKHIAVLYLIFYLV